MQQPKKIRFGIGAMVKYTLDSFLYLKIIEITRCKIEDVYILECYSPKGTFMGITKLPESFIYLAI